MSEREALLGAARLCRRYAGNLLEDQPRWAEVALECAGIIEEAAEVGLLGVVFTDEKTLPVVSDGTGTTTGSAKSAKILHLVSSDF